MHGTGFKFNGKMLIGTKTKNAINCEPIILQNDYENVRQNQNSNKKPRVNIFDDAVTTARHEYFVYVLLLSNFAQTSSRRSLPRAFFAVRMFLSKLRERRSRRSREERSLSAIRLARIDGWMRHCNPQKSIIDSRRRMMISMWLALFAQPRTKKKKKNP